MYALHACRGRPLDSHGATGGGSENEGRTLDSIGGGGSENEVSGGACTEITVAWTMCCCGVPPTVDAPVITLVATHNGGPLLTKNVFFVVLIHAIS